MIKFFFKISLALLIFGGNIPAVSAQDNVIDQIIWVVGDEAIFKSDVEGMKLQMQRDREHFDGDPDCFIPEQLAMRKLYLHQAKLDSIDVPASAVTKEANRQLGDWITMAGSKEKLEEYQGKPIVEIREELKTVIREREIIKNAQRKLVGAVTLTPSEVRRYYDDLPKDSLPYIPTTVEVQIVTLEPKIPQSDVDEVKNRLRSFTEQINKGETTFSTLALIYSEDTESAKKGGELGFSGRAELVPEFANAAFALTDPTKVSNIVETEYGYHIMQLIERRGDRVNVRHILLKPKVPQEEINKSLARMDTVLTDINAGKATFEEAAFFVSQDKTTYNNKGLMVNQDHYDAINGGTAKFTMDALPPEIAKEVNNMKVGEVSKPFAMLNKNGRSIVAMIKLRQRTEGHKANISDDYQMMKMIVENRKRDEILQKWLQNKIKDTYIWISEDWRNCDFQFDGWVK
ncbi:peptidyl-prolyl cis-trans isomerase SurA [Dysgonomonas sp. PH5-45]|uniref:peptidylprolyl isomerase n=1 Tax=unclassified Dysgonomonas TaxID=2630389 RepID=UPI002473D1F5|nr:MULTISPECIES: peptidylprolyl isomerase [unclassified Dysgonomonas]MDH6355332.1 peptidyl-prolyl cis-trans isomerase SurA [Dysgonomonas sp. PH5-45]MDH6388230.1 peptidyl-prolyl cis-trans isomerase SurA [Dysgonomonas sp. PH5-37]